MKKLKKFGEILVEMLKNHRYKPLKNALFYKDFLNFFDKKHQILIQKVFIKNKILFIIAKNHIAFQELNHENVKENVKFLVKIYAQKYGGVFEDVQEIKVLSQDYKNRFEHKEIEIKSVKKQDEFYLELSKGAFKNPFTNEEQREKFEKLREIIKKSLNEKDK